jgi:hypothetical protein
LRAILGRKQGGKGVKRGKNLFLWFQSAGQHKQICASTNKIKKYKHSPQISSFSSNADDADPKLATSLLDKVEAGARASSTEIEHVIAL